MTVEQLIELLRKQPPGFLVDVRVRCGPASFDLEVTGLVETLENEGWRGRREVPGWVTLEVEAAPYGGD